MRPPAAAAPRVRYRPACTTAEAVSAGGRRVAARTVGCCERGTAAWRARARRKNKARAAATFVGVSVTRAWAGGVGGGGGGERSHHHVHLGHVVGEQPKPLLLDQAHDVVGAQHTVLSGRRGAGASRSSGRGQHRQAEGHGAQLRCGRAAHGASASVQRRRRRGGHNHRRGGAARRSEVVGAGRRWRW